MESEQLENHFIQPLFRYSFIPTFRFFNFYVNVHQWLNETISMTYLRSQSVAILAFDEYRAEIRGIIVWGRIWCRWGFAFKWVAVSAEALQLLYRGFTASSLFMNKKSGMKPEEWVVFVLSSVLRQNASRTLFYRLFPFLCSHSLSLFFFHLQGSAGKLNPEPPYLTNCCHGNCCSLVSLMYPPPHPPTPILQTNPNTQSWRGENNYHPPKKQACTLSQSLNTCTRASILHFNKFR